MNKEQVINKLHKMRLNLDDVNGNDTTEIAEVICDISRDGNVVYPNESIIVYLVTEPSIDDLIINGNHWTICDEIREFDEGIVYGIADAKANYCKHYVSDFKEVKYFKGDF